MIGLYFSLDFDKIQTRIKGLIPTKHKDDGEILLHELNTMARGYVSGTLFTSLALSSLPPGNLYLLYLVGL